MSSDTKSAATAVEHFLAEHARASEVFEKNTTSWLKQLRTKGLEQFAQQGFPTVRDEDWKYTNVTPLTNCNFKWQSGIENLPTIPAKFSIEDNAQRLVFVNGHFAPKLSTLSALPTGVTITNLANALNQQPHLLEPYLGQIADQKTPALLL